MEEMRTVEIKVFSIISGDWNDYRTLSVDPFYTNFCSLSFIFQTKLFIKQEFTVDKCIGYYGQCRNWQAYRKASANLQDIVLEFACIPPTRSSSPYEK